MLFKTLTVFEWICIFNSEVQASSFERAIRLNMLSVTQFSGFTSNFWIDNSLIEDVIDLSKCVVVRGTHSTYLKLIESSISEEISWISENHEMSECCSSIKCWCSNGQDTVHSVIFSLSTFSIKHQICHSIIWISMPVAENIFISLVCIFL